MQIRAQRSAQHKFASQQQRAHLPSTAQIFDVGQRLHVEQHQTYRVVDLQPLLLLGRRVPQANLQARVILGCGSCAGMRSLNLKHLRRLSASITRAMSSLQSHAHHGDDACLQRQTCYQWVRRKLSWACSGLLFLHLQSRRQIDQPEAHRGGRPPEHPRRATFVALLSLQPGFDDPPDDLRQGSRYESSALAPVPCTAAELRSEDCCPTDQMQGSFYSDHLWHLSRLPPVDRR